VGVAAAEAVEVADLVVPVAAAAEVHRLDHDEVAGVGVEGDVDVAGEADARETEEGVLPSPELTRTDERPIEFRPVSEVEIPIAMRADAPNGDSPPAMVMPGA
jgi:hypothetical protein